MQRAVCGLFSLSVMLAVAPSVSVADDPAQPGTRWVGSAKRANPERDGKKVRVEYASTELALTIKTRTGKEFTGQFRVGPGKDARVGEVGGTIDEKGVADFRITKRSEKGTVNDTVDNWRCHGTFKDDKFIGKFQ